MWPLPFPPGPALRRVESRVFNKSGSFSEVTEDQWNTMVGSALKTGKKKPQVRNNEAVVQNLEKENMNLSKKSSDFRKLEIPLFNGVKKGIIQKTTII